MKRHCCILHAMMLAMFALLSVGIGFAQDGIKATIPFNFIIGKESFSPGDYTVTPLPQSLSKMLLRNRAGQILASIQTNPAESRRTPGSTKLVFNQYGEQYFLAQIWEAGNEFGQQLAKSPLETELAKARHSPAQLVALSVVPQR